MPNARTVFSASMLTLASMLVPAYADSDLIKLKSTGNVEQTVQRLEKILKEKGVNVVATVDHASAAAKVDMKLRPTRLVIFGNPKAGTPLMQCAQSTAIDLPQKALIYEDEKGQTWIAYNDMKYLAKRHNLGECGGAVESNAKALQGMMGQVAGGAR